MRTAEVCPTCSTYIDSKCIIYSGPYLSTLDIAPSYSIERSLGKINDLLAVASFSAKDTLVNFKWGKLHTDGENPIEFTKKIVMTDTENVNTYSVFVNKLIVDIPNFEQIKDYAPVLLLDRYKRKGLISQNDNTYRKSGYRHEPQDPVVNITSFDDVVRYSELPLTGSRSVLDFKIENYFKIQDGIAKGKGMASWGKFQNQSFIRISFRLRLTISGVTKETNSLVNLKVRFIQNANQSVFDAIITYNFA